MLEEMLKELHDEWGDDIQTPKYTFVVEPKEETIYVIAYNPQGHALQKFKMNISLVEVPLEQ